MNYIILKNCILLIGYVSLKRIHFSEVVYLI